MYRIIALAFCLILFSSPAYATSWEWLWGVSEGGAGISDPAFTGDMTVEGTVTAEGFISEPDLDLGGSVSLHECEGGTSCPAVSAGDTLRIALPDNANPLSADRTISPGRSLVWRWAIADMTGYLDGTYCIPPFLATGFTDAPLACSTLGNLASGYYLNGAFTDGLWIDHCNVIHSVTSGGWETTEVLVLQLQTVTPAGAIANIGSSFTIQANEDACGGSNCMTVADLTGYWDVSGSSAVADGAIQLRVTSGTVVGALNVRVQVDCKVF